MALGLTPQQIIDKDKNPLLRISKDWKRVLLDNLADVQNGYAFSSEYFNREKGLPLIRIRDIKRKDTENLYSGAYNETFVVSNNDILIGMDGDFYASKWPGEIGLLNQRVCRLIFNSEFYEKEFFFICIQPYLDAIHEETSSVTVKHLSSNTIKNIPLPLPPLPIQRAIVSKIETLFSDLDNGIADLKKAQDQLKIYRQAVLKKAFEGELTKEWREQQSDLPTADELLEQIKEERENHYNKQLVDWEKSVTDWEDNGKVEKKPGKPKKATNLDSKISVIEEVSDSITVPSSWSKEPLAYISDNEPNSIVDGPFGSSINVNEDYKDIGIPVIRMVNIRPLKFIPNNLKFIVDEKFIQLRRHNIISGDVLIAKVGATIGDCCIYPKNQPEGMLSTTGSCRVRLDKGIYSNKFLEYYIFFQKNKLKSIASQTAQPFLNMKVLKAYPIVFLSLPEQHQIVREIESRLSVCDKVEECIKQSLEKAQALRQSILKKAFEGKLLSSAEIEKCKAEADYEPASVLLERIRAERAAG